MMTRPRIDPATRAATKATTQLARNRAYKASNLCYSCGARPLAVGKSRCVECLATNAAGQVARMAAKKARGICLQCNDPVHDGRSHCEKHLLIVRNKYIPVRNRYKP